MVSNIRLFGYLLHFVSADYCSLFFVYLKKAFSASSTFSWSAK